MKLKFFISFMIFGISPAAAVAVNQFQITSLPGIEQTGSFIPQGFSSAGVVGFTVVTDDQGLDSSIPVLWQNGQTSQLPMPSGNTGVALAINSQGDIVGVTHSPGSYDPRPVLWRKGQIQF